MYLIISHESAIDVKLDELEVGLPLILRQEITCTSNMLPVLFCSTVCANSSMPARTEASRRLRLTVVSRGRQERQRLGVNYYSLHFCVSNQSLWKFDTATKTMTSLGLLSV